MESRRERASNPAANERAAQDERLTLDRAEEAWQRQVASEDAPAPTPVASFLRLVLLALAILAIVFLLFQRLAQLG